MKNKKLFIKVLLVELILCSTPVFSEDNLSESDLVAIYEVVNYKPVLTTMNSSDALKKIEELRNNYISNSNIKNLSEQGLLILDGLLTLEEVNYRFNYDTSNQNLESIIDPINEKLNIWIVNHKDSETSPWLFVVAGDLLAVGLNSYPVAKLLDVGFTIKNYYENALKNNPDFSPGNVSLAQWYFYAPFLAGGNKKKAQALFETGIETANGIGEQFFANLYYSQFLLDQKNKSGSKDAFSTAQTIQPNSKKLDFIKMLNDNGYTYFYYILNKDKVDKKLGL